jgi:dihydropteroate synthase
MGILNVTPDSFFDGGRFSGGDAAVERVQAMVEEGADLIDVGGESTRPAGAYGAGAAPVSEEEEARRVVPIIERIARDCPVPISVDTTKSGVARRALDAGADLVNDISALRFDPGMAPLVAARGVPVVLMHMKGTPRTMQQNPTYEDVIGEVRDFLKERIQFAVQSGIPASRLLIDPGLGFGKRLRDNFEILARLREFRALNSPLLIGPSRKAFVGVKAPPIPVEDRLEGTLAALALCVAHGADVVRVHDVRAAARACRLADAVVRRG